VKSVKKGKAEREHTLKDGEREKKGETEGEHTLRDWEREEKKEKRKGVYFKGLGV